MVFRQERPILGESHKPHFVANMKSAWNLPDLNLYEIRQVKFAGFHAWKPLNQIIQEKNFFHRVQGEAMSYELCEICRISPEIRWIS